MLKYRRDGVESAPVGAASSLPPARSYFPALRPARGTPKLPLSSSRGRSCAPALLIAGGFCDLPLPTGLAPVREGSLRTSVRRCSSALAVIGNGSPRGGSEEACPEEMGDPLWLFFCKFGFWLGFLSLLFECPRICCRFSRELRKINIIKTTYKTKENSW
jgi:hypothetical protein